jgi:DNA modification methylase
MKKTKLDIRTVAITDVEPWDKNPRGIKTKDFDRLKKQILKLGVYKPLICYKDKGKYVVLGGNMRIRALKEIGIKEVEVSIVKPKDEAQKIEFALSDNDRAGFYEEDKLAELVYPEIQHLDLTAFKVDLGEALDLKQVVERFGPDIDDGADEVPEVDDTPAITKPGDLFTLGKHRLLCGDSTKAEDVARLMMGEKADMVFTDPPYGVAYSGLGQSTSNQTIENDDLDPVALGAFLTKALTAMPCAPGCNAFVCHADAKPGIRPAFESAFLAAGFSLGATIIWVKQAASMGWQDFRPQHEPILFGWKNGGARVRVKDRSLTTVWEVKRDAAASYQHPTQKPVRLIEVAINSTSADDALVLDPFLGSGTTLIAAEKTGRSCYGMEIDPKYCDVIIKRYADYTKTDEKLIRKTREKAK